MLAGELYDPYEPSLVQARQRARWLCAQFNSAGPDDAAGREAVLSQLFDSLGPGCDIVPPRLRLAYSCWRRRVHQLRLYHP